MKKNRTLGFIWQIIIALFLLLPLTVSFIYSFAGRCTSILPQNLTFQFYIDKYTIVAKSVNRMMMLTRITGSAEMKIPRKFQGKRQNR